MVFLDAMVIWIPLCKCLVHAALVTDVVLDEVPAGKAQDSMTPSELSVFRG